MTNGKSQEDTLKRLLRSREDLEKQEKEMSRALKEQSDRLTEQWRVMEQQSTVINRQKDLLEEQRQRLDALRIQLDELGQPAGDIPAQPGPARTMVPRPATAPGADSRPSGPVGQAPPTRPALQQPSDILERRGVLTPRGTVVVEPSVQYVHSSVKEVFAEGYTVNSVLLVGAIEISEADRNSFIAALGVRAGLTNRLEFSARLPYVYRADRTWARPVVGGSDRTVETKADGQGLGDIEAGLNYLFRYADDGGPYVIGGLRIKGRTGEDPFEVPLDPRTGLQATLPTGSGFWSVQPGVSFSLPSDPAVLYGSTGYLWNVKRDVGGTFGTIDPGDAIVLGFGMAFALNQKASFNLGYSHYNYGRTQQNGQPMIGSKVFQVGTLLFGWSYRARSGANVGVSLGVGVTEDAPDVQLSVQFPSASTLSK